MERHADSVFMDEELHPSHAEMMKVWMWLNYTVTLQQRWQIRTTGRVTGNALSRPTGSVQLEM